jgi:putative aldouronate transport system permease protein
MVQTISYLPHFISIMVVCGMIIDFTATDGFINDIIEFFGGQRSSLLLKPELFRTIYISSDIWQNVGWGSIIYLAALTGVDTQLYEAAVIDGAGRWKQLLHVTLPGIAPTIVILLILRIGQIMNVGFEKIILLYNPATYSTADVISSFVYRKGLLEFSYSYSAAVGLFNSVINFILLILANKLSKHVNDISLW